MVARVRQVTLPSLQQEIIVVDDGSQDQTTKVLEEIPDIRLVVHEKNKGKGAALKTGIKNATGDIVLLQDADLEYDPQDYPALLQPILEGRSEFVMGSRFLYKRPRFLTQDGDPFVSHFIGNLMIIWTTNFLYGQKKTDYEGCYKVFTKSLIDRIPIRADGFEFDNELICKAFRRGYEIFEVPIRYSPRLYSEGKKIKWQDGVRMLWNIVMWRFRPF